MSNNVHPTTPSEFEEFLSDFTNVEASLKDGSFAGKVQDYVRSVNNRDQSIQQQVTELTQKALADFLKDNGQESVKRVNLDPSNKITQPKNAFYNKKAPGAALDAEFEGSADYFQAIWHNSDTLKNSETHAAKRNVVRKIQAAYSSNVPSEGGYLIPETLRSEILSVALESSIVRPRARVIPMETLRVPIPAIDSTSNATNVFGGVTCYWTEEGAQLVESTASFGRVVLDAKKLTGYAEMPNELVSDATAFGSFFDQVFPQAMAWYEDKAFFSGTGVGEPLGFLNASAAVSTSKESGQVADTIVWENIVKMYARMLPSSLDRAVWVAAPDTFPELATMALSVGTGGSAIWLNNGAAGPPMTILGRPVIFTEKAPTIGDLGDINFVDFGYYLIGDRQAMSAMSSPHYKFANDKTAFRIIERVDGRPWLQSAITPANGSSNTLSPFVKLEAR